MPRKFPNPLKWSFNQKCAALCAVAAVAATVQMAYPVIFGAMNAWPTLQEHTKAISAIKKDTDEIPRMQEQLSLIQEQQTELILLCRQHNQIADEPLAPQFAGNETVIKITP